MGLIHITFQRLKSCYYGIPNIVAINLLKKHLVLHKPSFQLKYSHYVIKVIKL